MRTTFRQSLTQRNTMVRSVFSLFQMTRYLVAVNYPCCNYNHLMTLSARISTNDGIVRPRSSAVFELIPNPNPGGCSTWRVAGVCPHHDLIEVGARRRNKTSRDGAEGSKAAN